MLVLNRKTDETIVIGENVEVTVLEVKGRRVKLGIAAPREVSVTRSELLPDGESMCLSSRYDGYRRLVAG